MKIDKNCAIPYDLILSESYDRIEMMIAPVHPKHATVQRKQRTLKKEAHFSGIGVHTGEVVNMRFCPAKEGTGIVFKRVDLASQPVIPATIEYVCDTLRCTSIGIGKAKIHTIEHVMAALAAYQIDNLSIELNNIEPPVGNGSSDIFVEMIENAGIAEQEAPLPIVKLEQPIYWSEGDIHIAAIPFDGFKISYTLNYPDSALLKAQFHSLVVSQESFKKEIAPCRTFSRYEEISVLLDKGLIKGGSLDNSVVIQDDVAFSKNGLFYPDEMVRHKILDMIGDLSLVGIKFHGHIMSIRSGHSSNFSFAKKIYQYVTMENH